jgi:hypothetical protein
MRSARRFAVALACLAAVAVAPPASAAETAASAVTLKVKGGPPFHGRVTSKNPACIANRRVKLLSTSPERGLIDFADNRTNGKGKWVFSSQLQGARVVQAKVTEQTSGGVTCRAALSAAKRLY